MKFKMLFLGLLLSIGLKSQTITDTIRIKEVLIIDTILQNKHTYKIKPEQEFSANTGDMLKTLPGITLLKRSSFSTEPMIRTFKYEQINTLIDGGIRASGSCPNRMDPITTRITPNEITSVEIIRGPYQVRKGQIFGGTINLITQNPTFDNSKPLFGKIGTEYATNGKGKTLFGNISASQSRLFVNVSADYRQFDNYKSGDETEIASSFQNYGFKVKGGVKINSNQTLTLNASYAEANDVLHAGLPMDAEYDKSTLLSANYTLKNITTAIQQLNSQFYYAYEDHKMTNKYRPNAKFSYAETPVTSDDMGGKIEVILAPSDNALLYLGADYKQTHKDGNKYATIYENVCSGAIYDPAKTKTAKVWQDSYNKDAGIFSEIKQKVAPNINLQAGIRMDYVTSEINDPESNFKAYYGDSLMVPDQFLFNYFITLDYRTQNNFQFELKAGKGTRNPDLLELYINHFTVGLDMYEYVGNPTLKPEENMQFDFIISKKGALLSAYFDVFYSNLSNYISAKADSSLPRINMPCKEPKFAKRFINIDNAAQYGLEIGMDYNFHKNLNLNATLIYNYAQNNDWDEPLPEIAPLIINAGLQFNYAKIKSEFSIEYQAKQDRIATSFGEKESESFFVSNFRISYALIKSLNTGLNISNIFNENYYSHLSRPYKNMDTNSPFFEPGRNFKFFIAYTF